MTHPLTRWTGRAVALVAAWVVAHHLLPRGAPPGVVVLGAVVGGVTAFTAIGLILVYRATRTVNFSHAALGGVGGTLGVSLHVEHGWSYAACAVAAVVVSSSVGAAAEFLVIRRFTRSSRLVATVATIGLAQVFAGVQLLVPRLLRSDTLLLGGFDAPIGAEIELGPVILTGNHLAALFAVPVITAGVSWALLGTDIGLAVRGAAENRERALLFGIPVSRLSMLVWGLAGALSALAFVLKAPFAGTTPDAAVGPTVLLAGLAAAVLAGMESLRTASLAAVMLGVLEQLVLWNAAVPALVDVLFLVAVLVGLFVRRDRLGRSPDDEVEPRARAAHPPAAVRLRRPLVIAFAVAAAFVPLMAEPSTVNLMSVGLLWGAVGVSLVVLTGWAGQVSLGQFALAGAGAFTTGNVLQHLGLDLFFALVLGGAAGAVIALLLGVPALRIDGPFLAVTTLGFAVVSDVYLLNPTYLGSWVPQHLGERPVLWRRLPLENEVVIYGLCLAFLVFVAVAAERLRHRRPGRVLLAVRDNAVAAETVGINSVAVRLSAFVISGVVAGVAGGLHVVLLHGAHVGAYQPIQSVQVFSMVVVGGVESVAGALLGVGGMRLAAGLVPEFRLLITGVGLLAVLLAAPAGLLRAASSWSRRPRKRAVSTRTEEPVDGTCLLSCRSVEAWYGSTQVLFGTDLDVHEGEVLAVLGTNGAGKSTLLNTIAGLVPEAGGSIRFRGQALPRDPRAVAAAGIALMRGGRSVFPSLTARENLRLAGWLIRRNGAVGDAQEDVLARFPALRPLLGRRAGDLSGGEQQVLALAQVLMLRPRLLLVDELTLGLSPAAAAQLLVGVRDLAAGGATIVVVEQSLERAAAVADHAVFLEKGEVRFRGSPTDLVRRPDLARAVFLRSSSTPRRRRRRHEPTQSALECRGLAKSFSAVHALDGVDVTVCEGEIVGLVGPNGAGKTTLIDCISGLLRPDAGEVVLGGTPVTRLPPWRRARAGLGRSFQHARLWPSLTVAECVAVALERHLRSRDPVAAAFNLPASYDSELEVRVRVDELLEITGLEGYGAHLVGELSTGTRRIVDLACALAHEPAVLLLDEPSAGIAQREAEALAPRLLEVRDRTECSMLVIEHDIPLITAVADRLVALDGGRVVCEGRPELVLSDERVLGGYTGRVDSIPRP